jgi:leucyl/phenylalanyl-tRNA--protein transferase
MAHKGRVQFYTADPRAVLPLDGFHLPRRMARELRQKNFEIRFTTSVEAVIRGCAGRTDTWINEEIVQVYLQLQKMGVLHSVEAWHEGELAGGLYGITLGGAFCGESMFHRVPSASKAALVALVERMRRRGFGLLDCQAPTEHTRRFGLVMMPFSEYLARLKEVMSWPCSFLEEKES